MNEYVEVAVYRIKPEFTTEQFLVAADATLADLQKLDGFLRHEMYSSEDGRWLDLIYYESQETAVAAEPILTAAASIQNIMTMLDMEEGTFFHATPAWHHTN